MSDILKRGISELSAGEVERQGYKQPARTEMRRRWLDGVYHYELRPAGYRTKVERQMEEEAEWSDSDQL